MRAAGPITSGFIMVALVTLLLALVMLALASFPSTAAWAVSSERPRRAAPTADGPDPPTAWRPC